MALPMMGISIRIIMDRSFFMFTKFQVFNQRRLTY